MEIKKNTQPFWNPMKGRKVEIHNYKLRMFFSQYGFGQFSTIEDRTSAKSIFHNDNGILKVHDEITIKKWVREWLESIDEDEYEKNGLLDTTSPDYESCNKWNILEQWQKLNGTTLRKQILEDLPIWSEEDLPYTSQINLFSDTHNSCHIRSLK
jgi:hypothetical protein